MNGGIEALGLWPRPKLDRPARFLGLTWRQWAYVGGAYTAGRWGLAGLAPALPYLPSWVPAAWVALCAVLGLLAVLVTWHGLDVARVAGVVLAHAATPPLSVWRPLDHLAHEDDPAAEEDDDDDLGLAEPEADDANPGAWHLPPA